MGYKIKLEVFEGPLDLLLFLIKKEDIDITDIPIAKITKQYLEYIEMMKMLDLDQIGDFLVMAATLMQIKSRMLLPPDPNEQIDDEDPREELVRRLTEYQQFKEIAEELKNKEEFRRDLFSRQIDEEARQKIKDDAREIFFEANLFDLINALTEALNKQPEDVVHEILKEEFTVEQKIHEILHLMLEKESVNIKTLFSAARSRSEMVVTFLAILELIRLKEIKILQKQIFGDIEISRNKDNIVPIDTDSDNG